MTRRQLLAFKRGPTVDIRLDDLIVEVKGGRVGFGIATGGTEYLSSEEWSDLARRVEHAINWIEAHTPEDADGRSYGMDIDQWGQRALTHGTRYAGRQGG